MRKHEETRRTRVDSRLAFQERSRLLPLNSSEDEEAKERLLVFLTSRWRNDTEEVDERSPGFESSEEPSKRKRRQD